MSWLKDCLYLNILSPKLSPDSFYSELLPVLVFIHGGAFKMFSGPGILVNPKINLYENDGRVLGTVMTSIVT